MIIIDDFTCYPEAIPLKTTSKVVYKKTQFSVDSEIPTSRKQTTVHPSTAIKHHHVTPLWAEAINEAKVEGKDWKKEFNKDP